MSQNSRKAFTLVELLVVIAIIGILIALLLARCSGRPELAEVEGKLTLDNEPLGNVKVTFVPDPEFGNSGRNASGVTDASGRFFLVYDDGSETPGVPVNAVRVVLKDMVAAESGRDEAPIPSRFSAEYSWVEKTPLKYEIQSGARQAFEMNLQSADE